MPCAWNFIDYTWDSLKCHDVHSLIQKRWEAPHAPGVAEASEADPYLLQV